MKPVMQTEMGRRGNCFSACLASLFELGIADVPNFYDVGGDDADAWWAAVRDWLRPRGFGVMSLSITPALLTKFEGYFIVCGQSARDLEHATIWRDGAMVHDPHPSQQGIVEPTSVDLLYPLSPAGLRAAA